MRTLLLLLPALILSGQTAPAPKAAATTKAAGPVLNYKESGSPTASVTVEAFTDYECPHCARFFKEFMPQFAASFDLVLEPVAVHCRHPCLVVFQAEPDEEVNRKLLPVAWTIDIQQATVYLFFATSAVVSASSQVPSRAGWKTTPLLWGNASGCSETTLAHPVR